MPRSEVLPWPRQKFGSRFLLHAHHRSASGTTTSGTRASPKPGNSPKKWVSDGWPNGCRYVVRKEETRMKSNGRWRRVNGIKPRYGRQRERRWTPTRAKAQDTRAGPNSLETHLMRKWGDIGHLRALSPWINGMELERKYYFGRGFWSIL